MELRRWHRSPKGYANGAINATMTPGFLRGTFALFVRYDGGIGAYTVNFHAVLGP